MRRKPKPSKNAKISPTPIAPSDTCKEKTTISASSLILLLTCSTVIARRTSTVASLSSVSPLMIVAMRLFALISLSYETTTMWSDAERIAPRAKVSLAPRLYPSTYSTATATIAADATTCEVESTRIVGNSCLNVCHSYAKAVSKISVGIKMSRTVTSSTSLTTSTASSTKNSK